MHVFHLKTQKAFTGSLLCKEISKQSLWEGDDEVTQEARDQERPDFLLLQQAGRYFTSSDVPAPAGGDWLPLKAFFYLALQAPFLLPLAQKTLGVRHRQAHSGRLDNVAVFLNLAPGCPSALRNVWRDWSKMWVSQSPGFTWSQPTPPPRSAGREQGSKRRTEGHSGLA